MGLLADSTSRTQTDIDAVRNGDCLYTMDETKLTIRVKSATLQGAKRNARGRTAPPRGGSSPDVSLQDYREHLERRHA